MALASLIALSLPKRNMPRQVIKAARTGYDGLLRRQPTVGRDPVGDQLPALYIRKLHIDGADAELLVAEQSFVVRRHVVLDQIEVTIDPANKIGLVATSVEIAMPDLAVIVRSDGVIALADMYAHMHVVG